uniref:Serine/threonine-protein kinase ATR n=1 Tax=Schistocephalus solidus TaxID=70667 RepID=A0A0X3Q239_SCHSO
MDVKKSLLSSFDAAALFSESSSILPEDTAKLVYCILDEICSNLTRNAVQEDVALLPLLMCVENAFCRRHYHIFQTLTGEDIHTFVTWCLHRLVWIAIRGSFRQVHASVAAAVQIFSALECHLLSDITFHAHNFISAGNYVLQNMEAFDNDETQKEIVPFTLQMLSSISDRFILDNNIELRFFPITLEKITESYKFLIMASRLVGQFIPFLLSLRTSLITPALRFLTDAIELSDLNGKWQALEALSTCIDVVGQISGPVTVISIDWVDLLSRAVANALISLSFLPEIATADYTITFREHSGPDKFVLVCCHVLRKLADVLPAVEFWPCPGSERIQQLLQVCVICLERYPTLKFPRKMQLLASVMMFLQEFIGFRSTSSHEQTLSGLWQQIYAIMHTESYFKSLFSVDETPADILSYVEAYDQTWNEVIQFFGTCLEHLGQDSVNSVISDLSLLFLTDIKLNEPDWLQVSALVSASLATLVTTGFEHCDAVSSLPGLLLPQLFRALADPQMQEPNLLFQLRTLFALLEASIDELIVVDLDSTEVKCLTDLLTAINQHLPPNSVDQHCLLGISLRIAVLLSAFCSSNGLNFSLNIFADAASTICQLGILGHWLQPFSMASPPGLTTVKGRWVVAGPLLELIRILIRALPKASVDNFECNVLGILELARLPICFSWVTPLCRGLRLTCCCSRCPREVDLTKARGQETVLKFSFLLHLLRQFDSPLPSQKINSGKIDLACHIAQHVSWTVVTVDEVIEFCRLILTFYAQPDPLHLVSLSDVFGELCANLLPSDPCKWVQVQRELNSGLTSALPLDGFPHLTEQPEDHCQAAGSELLLLRAETLLLTWGALSRQLAKFQGTEAVPAVTGISTAAVTVVEENGGIRRLSAGNGDAGVGINSLSVHQPEFVYCDLLREMVAAICRIALGHHHAHSIVGAAYVQIDELSACLGSNTLCILRDARKPIAEVLVRHLDPTVSQAFDIVARIFQVEKRLAVRELMAATFTYLVVKGTQESHLRIRQLVELGTWLTGCQDYVTKITQLCILPDTLVHVFTQLSDEKQAAALKFLESHLGLPIERVARMNDVSRLLHQFVLCLYPHRREACAGLRWLVSKVVHPMKPIYGLLALRAAEGHAEAAVSDVTTMGLTHFLGQHLCGILAFFDCRLLDDESPLEERKRALLSLAIFMDLVGTQPVSRMRAKFIATLKLCLRYKFVEPNVVVQLWTMFLKMLEPESLSELLPDVGANLVSLYNIAPDRVSEAFANIFVQRRNQLEPVLSKLFFLPVLPGLEKYQSVLNEVCPWRSLCCAEQHFTGTNDLLSPPPTDLSDLLCAWLSALTHSSRPVRRLCLASLVPPSLSLLSAATSPVGGQLSMPPGLMNLSRLLMRTLRSLVSSGPTAMTATEEVTDGETGVDMIQGHRTPPNNATVLFANLLTCLLTGLTRDSDEEIRLLYSQWLGALGPVDPSRLVLSSGPTDTPSTGSVEKALNWSHLFPFDVLMELAKIYMRAASPKQLDSTALAIQELLRLFAVPGTTSTRSGDVAATTTSSNIESLNGVSLFISGRDLWMRFPQNVQDLFSPLLSSRYALETFTDWSTIQFPIIIHPSCQSYESWIRLWSGSLKIYVSDPVYYRLFQVCEPVVKSDVEFARYLLNHIALQVLVEGSETGVAKLRSEVFGVLQLVTGTENSSLGPDCKILTTFLLGTSALTENNEPVREPDSSANWQTWYPLAAQTVFSLLDHLSSWQRARSADRTAAIAACASANSRNSTGSILSGGKPTEAEKLRLKQLETGINRVSEFLEGLPHTLQARASLRMGGLARALRHWESAFAEDKAAQKTVYVTGFVCDHPGDTDVGDEGRRLLNVGSESVGSAGQEAMTGLLNTYASLHDNDGISGVLALMQSVGGLEGGCSHLLQPRQSTDGKATGTGLGVSGPAYQTSMLRALQLENEDQLDLACATYEHALTTLLTREDSGGQRQGPHQQQQQQLGLHVGLFRCQMPDPARLQALLARTDALLRSAAETEPVDEPRGDDAVEAWTRELNAYRAEAALRLADWDKLGEVVATTESSRTSWPVGLGKLFLSLKKGAEPQVRSCLNELRLSQMFDLSTAALEGSRGYWRAYEPIVRLGILSEVEVIAGLSAQLAEQTRDGVLASDLQSKQRKSDLLIDNLLAWLEARFQQSRPTLHTLEPVLAIRHAALQLATSRLRAEFTSDCLAATSLTPIDRLQRHQLFRLESALADSWLQRAKLARKAGQAMAAYTCVLHAETCGSPGALLERAKLLWQTGKREAALTCLDEGLAGGVNTGDVACAVSAATAAMPPPADHRHLSRATGKLRSEITRTTYSDASCAQQALLLRARYCEETSRFDFDTTRRLYSDICETYSGCEEAHFRLAHYVDEARSQVLDNKQNDLLLKVALEHYGEALACGNQFIYQSMPRFLTLWLDYGAEFAQKQATTNGNNVRAGVAETAADEDPSGATFEEVQALMRASLQKIPPYQFYTALGQILSRVCHEHPSIVNMLVDLIVRVFVAFPQQTIWFLMSLHDSTVPQRRERCQQIFAQVRCRRSSLSQFITDFVALCGHLRSICDLFMTTERRDSRSFSIRQTVRSLTRLVENSDLSQVLIPLHRQLVPTLLRPRAPPEEVRDHQPFGSPDRFVCLARLEDTVDILGSQTRPKKMYWVGSDGRRYVIVAKPNDDLRKDSRLMELNGMINKFLMKNPETRRRALQIRTYAVIPLSEKGGLIEWVCNTQPFRSILSKLYIEVNHPINWANMSRLAPLLEDSLEVKRDKYLNKWLPMYPLVFYRWFLHTFPNPSAWYAAREAFARTCAVMSMVGYVLGLGDRHTENILFDSTTGGLVHVDFSCVFNTGLTLPWPERVPFRLTRNLVHAMGPTGYEGIFRRCAEAVMRLLRREVDPLLAVFRPIYFDALVEQGAGRATDAARRGRRPGNAAVSKPVDRITRAAMEKLAGMEDRLRGKITEHDAFGQLLPMSVEGQVDALIKEATSVDRLCQMYKGWMPFM